MGIGQSNASNVVAELDRQYETAERRRVGMGYELRQGRKRKRGEDINPLGDTVEQFNRLYGELLEMYPGQPKQYFSPRNPGREYIVYFPPSHPMREYVGVYLLRSYSAGEIQLERENGHYFIQLDSETGRGYVHFHNEPDDSSGLYHRNGMLNGPDSSYDFVDPPHVELHRPEKIALERWVDVPENEQQLYSGEESVGINKDVAKHVAGFLARKYKRKPSATKRKARRPVAKSVKRKPVVLSL